VACHRDCKSAKFSPPVCSPQVICGPPPAFYRDLLPATNVIMGAKDKFYIYIVYVNFSKIVAFKGKIRKYF
jgi:hypothetical protein